VILSARIVVFVFPFATEIRTAPESTIVSFPVSLFFSYDVACECSIVMTVFSSCAVRGTDASSAALARCAPAEKKISEKINNFIIRHFGAIIFQSFFPCRFFYGGGGHEFGGGGLLEVRTPFGQ